MDPCGANKCCAVPLCQSRTLRTPEKIFIPVPLSIKKRNLWLRLAKRNPKKITGDAEIYFCEDHFDLETDATNYPEYKMGLTEIIEMVPGCIPTKFKCQMNHKMSSKTRNIVVTKKLLDLTDEQKKQSEAANSAAQSIAGVDIADVKNTNAQELKSDAGITEKIDQFQKVFSSERPKSNYMPSNNLYDLLKIVPARPVVVNETQSTTCNFTPNTDKYYMPKQKSRLKVRTVRSIRKAMEHDVYSYLPKALENQKSNLLKKIMGGTSRGETTHLMAKKMLNSDQPILRSSWQMLMNINPENHPHSKQYVLWNGKSIQINGSKGGKNKFVCNYDLGSPIIKPFTSKKKISNKKKGLLQNSLAIRFKPGPLGRKKYLDDSHQKYHVGLTELVHLPKAGLDIQPFYGMTLEPGIAKFVNSLRQENGSICRTWAEFAVTMLGSIKKSNAVQNNPDTMITFDLNYKYNQHRILMRRDIQDSQSLLKVHDDNNYTTSYVPNDSMITSEIEQILEKMLDSVEISLEQDNLYTGKDEPRETACDRPINMCYGKEKPKKRCSELGRLDVTVIRLPEDNRMNEQRFCNKPFCNLGCVCASLECSYNLKPHCGLVGCMFQCVCDFSRYKDADILRTECSDFLPGLINLDSEINLNLAKEEQKFRQTVIVSGEKSILLKSQKRNWKASKKYADFYTNLNLKSNKKTEMVLSIVGLNLNCQNIEPWCMVHNLYKCFCKGKFTESSIFETNEDNAHNNDVENLPVNTKDLGTNDDLNLDSSKDEGITNETNTSADLQDSWLYVPSEPSYTCARVKAYKGRKYNCDYYKKTNIKITQMEQNDAKLKKRLTFILNKYAVDVKASMKGHPITESGTILDVGNGTCDKPTPCLQAASQADIAQGEPINKSKLVAWLESSYKLYKHRMNQGIQKTTLEPPVSGKLALYTWEFILKRYKQKKNFFMVNKQAPFRIFIAVDGKSSFFDNCININNIELADLHTFPVTVKNLLTDACDSPEDFCILCGWNECWEIIGSVSKLNDKCESGMVNENVFTSNDFFSAKTILTEVDNLNYKDKVSIDCPKPVNRKRHSNSESSKWFLMTVENDFSEIQFHTRGFFVTYSSIIRAINVARRTSKTVRLSSQKCAEKGSDPQFGIYAIPDSKEYCVFVGPYEIHEPLGIETVVNSLYIKKNKKTRGVWITTDKVDNGKVIDNPLSYMPFSHMERKNMVNLEGHDSIANANTEIADCLSSQINLSQVETSSEDSDVAKTPTKCMKPIKIRKTQDFYHIASNGALKKIFYKTSKKPEDPNDTPSYLLLHPKPIAEIIKSPSSNNIEGSDLSEKLNNATSSNQTSDSPELLNLLNKNSEAETTLQPKISAVFFTRKNETQTKKPEKGMFILKPEEINQRVLNKTLDESESANPETSNFDNKGYIDMDIENFLSNSVECRPPEAEVLEISDDSCDENEDDEIKIKQIIPKEVWIQCTNIDNFGWIKGLKNNDNCLSFEFPGFKPTDFYEIKEAFFKINQVLSRKVYITKNLTPEWEIVESESKLKIKNMLDTNQLGPDFVLTKHGIRHKQDLLMGKALQDKVKPGTKHSVKIEKVIPACTSVTSKVALMTGLEEQSESLENENKILLRKTFSNKAKILQSLSSASEETKQDMTHKLKTIMSMNE